MRGGKGPFGTVSIWLWSPLCFGSPLNLILYIPFRIFAYSSNILKTNFDLMDSTPATGTLNQVRLSCKSFSLDTPLVWILWFHIDKYSDIHPFPSPPVLFFPSLTNNEKGEKKLTPGGCEK
jgi:hypothetical protein